MRKADNLPPSCAVVTKSGSPKFLEPSGPVQACNVTDLPFFTLYVYNLMYYFHDVTYFKDINEVSRSIIL